MFKLKTSDLELLRQIQDDATLTHEAISVRLHMSRSSVTRRIEELRKARVIAGFHGLIDEHKVGFGMTTYVQVALTGHNIDVTDAFERELKAIPNVVEWSRLSQEWDYLLKLVARDTAHFAELHRRLRQFPSIKLMCGLNVIGQVHRKPVPLDLGAAGMNVIA